MGSINNPVDSNINTEKYRMDRRPGCLMRRSVSVMRRMRLEARSSLSWLITSVEYHHDRPFEVSLFERTRQSRWIWFLLPAILMA